MISVSPGFTISRQASPGLTVTSVCGAAHQELHLTIRPVSGERPSQTVRRLATAVNDLDAKIVRHEIFGPTSFHPEILRSLHREFGHLDWPLTWIGGTTSARDNVSGMHVFAVAGTPVATLSILGRAIGRVYSDGRVRHCFIGDMRPLDLTASNPSQCRETFEHVEHLLLEAGMSMVNVVRTWFFLDRISSWYRSFNTVRSVFYHQRGVFHGPLPASTGIGSSNPAKAALSIGAWAIRDIEGSVSICQVPSPMQCPSLEYGSAFSRAVLILEPSCRRLLVSGTASIAPNGCSAHPGNVREQISLTMEVVRNLLVSQGFSSSDITRATAYFKNIQDVHVFDEWRQRHDLGLLPVINTQSDICRKDLLFEIELDAISLAGITLWPMRRCKTSVKCYGFNSHRISSQIGVVVI